VLQLLVVRFFVKRNGEGFCHEGDDCLRLAGAQFSRPNFVLNGADLFKEVWVLVVQLSNAAQVACKEKGKQEAQRNEVVPAALLYSNIRADYLPTLLKQFFPANSTLPENGTLLRHLM